MIISKIEHSFREKKELQLRQSSEIDRPKSADTLRRNSNEFSNPTTSVHHNQESITDLNVKIAYDEDNYEHTIQKLIIIKRNYYKCSS